MTLFIKNYRHILSFAGIALMTLALSACGGGGNIDLSGAAGLGEATEEASVEPLGEAPAVEAAPEVIPSATGHIIFASNRGGQMDLYMTTPDGSELTRLTTNAELESGSTPQISPDGTKVAFVSTVGDNTDIYILDIATSAIQRLTDQEERDSSPSWSPDGQRIAFESFRDGNLEIYVMNADGSNPARLTDDSAGDSNPTWAPNSNDILFITNRFGNSDLILVGLNGVISPLTATSAPENAPTWSPDGSLIAFQSFSGELSHICLIGRDGLNQHCITSKAAEYGRPVWSQDGRWIAVNYELNGLYGIIAINLKDGSVVELSQPGIIEPRGAPAWSPDGVRLVFQAQSGGDMELYHAVLSTGEFTRVTSMPEYDGEPVWVSR